MAAHPVPASLIDPRLRGERALEDLGFIRAALERAGRFSAISGAGVGLIGLTALVAALMAPSITEAPGAWLFTWLGEAALAAALGMGSVSMRARLDGVPVFSGVGRRFLLSLAPPFAAAAALTGPMFAMGATALLPGLWMLLYGAGMLSAGPFCIRPVARVGFAFMAMGALTLIAPPAWANAALAVAFGGLHLVLAAVLLRGGRA